VGDYRAGKGKAELDAETRIFAEKSKKFFSLNLKTFFGKFYLKELTLA